jgi:hypothetical protein
LVVLLLALAILVVATGSLRGWRLALLGMIGAALVFTKINVGVFYGVALLMTLSSYAPLLQSRRGLFWCLLISSGSLPFLLMREHLAQAGGCGYSSVVCASIIAAGAFTYILAGARRVGFREWLQTGIPFGVVSVLVLLAVLVNGTSLSAMMDSTIKVPAGLPDARNHPLIIPLGVWASAAALLTGAVALRFRGDWPRFELAIAAVKGSYGLLGTLLFVTEFKIQLGYLLPWLWLALIQVPKNSLGQPRDLFPRAMLCLLAGWQGLQAYPMAGTQVCLATFLAILVYSICVHDAWVALTAEARLKEHLPSLSPRTALLLQGLVLGGLLQLLVVRTLWRWADYASVPRVELRGAHYLRLPELQGQDYRALAQYLDSACDTFICTPLLNSLYLWTDKRPPTWFNVNGGGIPDEEGPQAQVVAALRQARHPLILVREREAPSYLGARPGVKGPLISYMRESCLEIKRLSGFRILAPKTPTDHLSACSGLPGTRQCLATPVHRRPMLPMSQELAPNSNRRPFN